MIGKCNCGAVKFKINCETQPNLYQCHCSLCRKQSGTSSNAATLVHESEFSWTAGEDKITRYKMKDGFTSHFCSVCGSPVPNRLRDTDKIWVPAGLLPGDIDFRIVAHIYTGSKASWETVLHDGKQHNKMPDFESLYNLIHMKD